MLIKFTIENYSSFKEKACLDMQAVNAFKELREDSVFDAIPGVTLLKCAGIFGANASGKTNFLDALNFMSHFVSTCVKGQEGEPINVMPFVLSSETEGKPSSFEIEFIAIGRHFKYGFKVDKQMVHEEYLFELNKSGTETTCFLRKGKEYSGIPSSFAAEFDEDIRGKTRSNALLLSTSAQFNAPIATQIMKWFIEKVGGMNRNNFSSPRFTLNILNRRPELKDKIVQLLKVADFGIDDIEIVEHKEEKAPDNAVKAQPAKTHALPYEVYGAHKSYDQNGQQLANALFSFDDMESVGTRKYFRLAGPVVEYLSDGGVLYIDEIDSSMHPWMLRSLIALFNSKLSNKKNAQLIFTTHSPTVLNLDIMRRDQIWFADKDTRGASTLRPLSDFKVRNTTAIEKQYLEGAYGGVPGVGDLQMIFKD